MRYKAAIFDMDGTVLDTVEDLKNAMNYALEQTGHRHDFTYQDTCIFFGSGVRVALARALSMEAGMGTDDLLLIGTEKEKLPETVTEAEIDRIQAIYRPYYEAHCTTYTGPYSGITELLEELRSQGVLTAVVSNKPDGAVQKLEEDYFKGMFDLSIGEKAGIRRKPFPDMTKKALNDLGIASGDAVYIGDSEIDILTAENADMDCICVDWGFRPKTYLKEKGAKTIVSDPAEIARIILGNH